MTGNANLLPLIFAAGIHGVGKTSIAAQVGLMFRLRHVTAGDLIRDDLALGDDGIRADQTKEVSNVDENQQRLLRALGRVRREAASSEKRPTGILMDGHFCVRASEERIVNIPIEVFASINPKMILLLEANCGAVAARLLERDGKSPSEDSLRAFAEQEGRQARRVSAALGVPLRVISADEEIAVVVRQAASHVGAMLNRSTVPS